MIGMIGDQTREHLHCLAVTQTEEIHLVTVMTADSHHPRHTTRHAAHPLTVHKTAELSGRTVEEVVLCPLTEMYGTVAVVMEMLQHRI